MEFSAMEVFMGNVYHKKEKRNPKNDSDRFAPLRRIFELALPFKEGHGGEAQNCDKED